MFLTWNKFSLLEFSSSMQTSVRYVRRGTMLTISFTSDIEAYIHTVEWLDTNGSWFPMVTDDQPKFAFQFDLHRHWMFWKQDSISDTPPHITCPISWSSVWHMLTAYHENGPVNIICDQLVELRISNWSLCLIVHWENQVLVCMGSFFTNRIFFLY